MNTRAHTGFLACRDCGVLLPVLVHAAQLPDGAPDEAMDAHTEFCVQHRAHRTVRFRRHGTASAANRPLWDPMATITFEATDGQHVYVVTATRSSIDEPRVYRFTPGILAARDADVNIDEALLRRALDREFFPHALRASKLDRFVTHVRQVIRHVDPNQLAIAFDDADDPAVSLAALPEAAYHELLSRCAEIFDPWELTRVADFLGKNRDADGLLALRVHRHLSALIA